MRRSLLPRRTPLSRAPLARSRTRHPRLRGRTPGPAEAAWKRPRYGRCENCGLLDNQPLHGHHVVERPVVARLGVEWDQRNLMGLCARCHFEHHYGMANRKIVLQRVPGRAVAFAVEVLGEAQAIDYFRRRYAVPATNQEEPA